MKKFISNFKICLRLWHDLSYYVWGGTWTRAFNTCKKLDRFKEKHKFIYYITMLF